MESSLRAGGPLCFPQAAFSLGRDQAGGAVAGPAEGEGVLHPWPRVVRAYSGWVPPGRRGVRRGKGRTMRGKQIGYVVVISLIVAVGYDYAKSRKR